MINGIKIAAGSDVLLCHFKKCIVGCSITCYHSSNVLAHNLVWQYFKKKEFDKIIHRVRYSMNVQDGGGGGSTAADQFCRCIKNSQNIPRRANALIINSYQLPIVPKLAAE